VLVADVVGYSRHLARDEIGTLTRLATIRRELVSPALDNHRGRLVRFLGDGILAEFPTTSEAVGCAAAVQIELTGTNVPIPQAERIECRVGINFGDIVDVAGDIYGTDVNIAARLEALAAPGTICLPAPVYDQVRDSFAGEVSDLGPRSLKNIDRPIHVYQLRPTNGATFAGRAERRARRPSVAVLPFEMVGTAADEAYFGEGIAEDLISALSRCRWFFVVSRHSSFALSKTGSDLRAIAARLGVRYILDGTVRRSGDRLRIVARLVDGHNGTQIWTERYDRAAGDLFLIQDEIVETIATTIEPELEITELQNTRRKAPDRLDAQDCFYRGHWHFHQTNQADNETAKHWYRRALEHEPGFARAIAGLAYAHYAETVFGYTTDPQAAVAEAFQLARQAVSLDPRDAFAHLILGRISMLMGRHEASISQLRRAIELNPNNGQAHYGLGFSLVMAGQPERGLPYLERAQRLSPNDPLLWAFHTVTALAHQILGAEAEAEFAARHAVESPTAEFWAWLQLAIALAHRGKRDEAGAALAEALAAKPDFSIDMLDRTFAFRDPAHRDIYVGGLIAAGLKESANA